MGPLGKGCKFHEASEMAQTFPQHFTVFTQVLTLRTFPVMLDHALIDKSLYILHTHLSTMGVCITTVTAIHFSLH